MTKLRKAFASRARQRAIIAASGSVGVAADAAREEALERPDDPRAVRGMLLIGTQIITRTTTSSPKSSLTAADFHPLRNCRRCLAFRKISSERSRRPER